MASIFKQLANQVNLPFAADDERKSVMEPPSERDNSRKQIETILTLAGSLAPIGKAVSAVSALPKMVKAAIGTAAPVAVTGDPADALSNPVLSLALGSGNAEAAIRPFGKPELNMTHESPMNRLIQILRGHGHLSNPSIAISANNPAPFNGGELGTRRASLVMNPMSARLDPKNNPLNQLINRDAFVTRSKNEPLPKEFRTGEGVDLRGSEGVELDINTPLTKYMNSTISANFQDMQHLASTMASPRFRSLAAYERSPYGAATLSGETSISHPTVKDVLDTYNPRLVTRLNETGEYSSRKDIEKVIDLTREEAKREIKEGVKPGEYPSEALALDALRKAHSSYAENKVIGNLPINPANVSAILVSDVAKVINDSEYAALKKEAAAKGIRYGTSRDLLEEYAPNTLENYRKIAKVLVNNPKLADTPAGSKYINRLDVDNTLYDVKYNALQNPEEAILSRILQSKQANADVASILTQKDIDAALTPFER